MNIINYVAIILLVIGLILIFFGFMADVRGYAENAGACIKELGAGLACLGIMTIMVTHLVPAQIEYESKDRSSYAYYLDGTEVSSTNIDVKLYDHTYDDENHKVYLTHKTPTDNSGIGFGIGWISRGMLD